MLEPRELGNPGSFYCKKRERKGERMDVYVKAEVCDKVHRRVDERLEHHERWLGEHERKIDMLEKSDATKTTEIKNLCDSIKDQSKRLGKLTTAIWGLVTGIFMVLLGFFVWYVQQLGGR